MRVGWVADIARNSKTLPFYKEHTWPPATNRSSRHTFRQPSSFAASRAGGELSFLPLLAKVGCNLCFAFVGCPVGGCSVPQDIFHVESSAALYQQMHYVHMA